MKVSVIIPVYNSANTIIRALDSVIVQSVKPFEIIVVDDGSIDRSYSIIQMYADRHPAYNFKIISKSNGGVSSARNEGIKIAQGDYIAFLDSDDEWLDDKVEKQLKVLNTEAAYSFVGGLITKPNSPNTNTVREITLSHLIFKNYFQPSTVMFKREIIENVGLFDESQNYAEEGNYFMRVAHVYRCCLMNEQLIIYGQGKGGFGESGLSANLKEMEIGELRNLSFAFKKRYISLIIYIIAVVYSILKYIRRVLIVKLISK